MNIPSITPFQAFLYGFFAVIALVSITLLALFESGQTGPQSNQYGQVVVWGTLDKDVVNPLLETYVKDSDIFSEVLYVEIDPRKFDDEFINAIAEGRSPDLVILPEYRLVRHRNKLAVLQYDERKFIDTYIDGAQIFVMGDQQLAVPIMVDPLVMYWNRDIFAEHGLALPPSTWQQLVLQTVPAITKTDTRRNIILSAVAMGEYRNIRNAQAILVTLMAQAGSPLVYLHNGEYRIGFTETNSNHRGNPADTSIQFYTEFANPTSQRYSWNRVQPEDLNAFTAGDLALYFGFASEFGDIRRRNPNLNIDMTVIPQGVDATAKRTYGTFYGVAIPQRALNFNGATAAAYTIFSDPVFVRNLSYALGMAPTQRTTIANDIDRPETSAPIRIALKQALISRGWLSPGREAADAVFQQMIEDILSSRQSISAAITDAQGRLKLLY